MNTADLCNVPMKRPVMVIFVLITILAIFALQIYGDLLRGIAFQSSDQPPPLLPPSPSSEQQQEPETHPSAPEAQRPSIHYNSTHQDPNTLKDPYEIEKICSHLPTQRSHPRGIFLEKETQDRPIKFFYWRQQIYTDLPIHWDTESLDLCPFAPELQPFFDYYHSFHVKEAEFPAPAWESGFAPCWFWRRNIDTEDIGKVRSCDTPMQQQTYISTSNYTEFRDADIIYFDYPFYNYIRQSPFWDLRRMPPRLAHQRWVFKYGRESIESYPHVALPSFLQQFDLTIGSPFALFDVPFPLEAIWDDYAMEMTRAEPGFPVDQKETDSWVAWVVSNCNPRNNRNEVMEGMMKKLGAHSYGKCFHNRDIPTDILPPDSDWRVFLKAKRQLLGQYPFTFVAENSNCPSYVTEKIYDALGSGSIPIYMGASDIAEFVPAGSYIHYDDFGSDDELFAYLKTVDRAQFYRWKDEVKKDVTKFCKSCFLPKEKMECTILDHVQFV